MCGVMFWSLVLQVRCGYLVFLVGWFGLVLIWFGFSWLVGFFLGKG